MDLTWATKTNAHGNLEDIMYAGVDGFDHSMEAYDFDLYVDPGLYPGATGAEPEYDRIASTRANGDYEIYIDLYDSPRRLAGGAAAGTGYRPTTLLNLTPVLTVSKPGLWVKEIQLSNIWTSNTIPSRVGGAFTAAIYAGKVTKAGNTFTLFDEADVQLATGRAAGNVMPKVARNK